MENPMNEELMTREGVEAFLDRWMNDPGFPDQLRKDPRDAFRSLGLEPSDELIASITNMDASTSFETLKERLSKGVTLN